jgi:excisionase family DNA binding protein
MLMSVDDASRYLAVHHGTVRRWIKGGRIPTVRIGRRVLIRVDVLEELVNDLERPKPEQLGVNRQVPPDTPIPSSHEHD